MGLVVSVSGRFLNALVGRGRKKKKEDVQLLKLHSDAMAELYRQLRRAQSVAERAKNAGYRTFDHTLSAVIALNRSVHLWGPDISPALLRYYSINIRELVDEIESDEYQRGSVYHMQMWNLSLRCTQICAEARMVGTKYNL